MIIGSIRGEPEVILASKNSGFRAESTIFVVFGGSYRGQAELPGESATCKKSTELARMKKRRASCISSRAPSDPQPQFF